MWRAAGCCTEVFHCDNIRAGTELCNCAACHVPEPEPEPEPEPTEDEIAEAKKYVEEYNRKLRAQKKKQRDAAWKNKGCVVSLSGAPGWHWVAPHPVRAHRCRRRHTCVCVHVRHCRASRRLHAHTCCTTGDTCGQRHVPPPPPSLCSYTKDLPNMGEGVVKVKRKKKKGKKKKSPKKREEL